MLSPVPNKILNVIYEAIPIIIEHTRGLNAKITPIPVAAPFPPLKFTKQDNEKQT